MQIFFLLAAVFAQDLSAVNTTIDTNTIKNALAQQGVNVDDINQAQVQDAINQISTALNVSNETVAEAVYNATGVNVTSSDSTTNNDSQGNSEGTSDSSGFELHSVLSALGLLSAFALL